MKRDTKISLRIPNDIKDELRAKATRLERNLNWVVCELRALKGEIWYELGSLRLKRI